MYTTLTSRPVLTSVYAYKEPRPPPQTAWQAIYASLDAVREKYPGERVPFNTRVIALMSAPAIRPLIVNCHRRARAGAATYSLGYSRAKVNKNLIAALIQASGVSALVPCRRCHEGNGLWVGCVVVPMNVARNESTVHACANCYYTSTRCNWYPETETDPQGPQMLPGGRPAWLGRAPEQALTTTNSAPETRCPLRQEHLDERQLSEDLAARDNMKRKDHVQTLNQTMSRVQGNLEEIDHILQQFRAEGNQGTHEQEAEAEEVGERMPIARMMENNEGMDFRLVVEPEQRIASQMDHPGQKDFKLNFTVYIDRSVIQNNS